MYLVVRPSGTTRKDKLPVLVRIYSGGLYAGATADPQYNLSGITHVGQDIGKPVFTGRYFYKVSLNYRLGVWEFLQTPQLLAEGNSNAGLLDQRLAFRWIKENIGAFGGDTNRITIWGESAGSSKHRISSSILRWTERQSFPICHSIIRRTYRCTDSTVGILFCSCGKLDEDDKLLYFDKSARMSSKPDLRPALQCTCFYRLESTN